MLSPIRGRGAAALLSSLAVSAGVFAAGAAPAAAQTTITCSKYAAPTGSDSNSGTLAAPYKTPGKLAASLSSGQTGCLRGGTYSATSSQNILDPRRGNFRLASYPGERATLRGVVMIRDGYAPNVTLQGITFRSIDAPTHLIRVYAPDFKLFDSDVSTGFYPEAGSCLLLSGNAARPVISRNKFFECGDPNDLIPGSGNVYAHAIYASSATDGVITDNVFWKSAGKVITFRPSTHRTRFANNVIDAAEQGGTGTKSGFVFAGTSSNNVAEKNVIMGAEDYNMHTTENNGMSGNIARDNCLFGAGRANVGSTAGATFTNTVIADPRFVNRAERDYRLQADSGCLKVVGYDTAAKVEAAHSGLSADSISTPTTDTTTAPTTDTTAVNKAPTVKLTSPLSGGSFRSTLKLAAQASDDKTVARVEFHLDGKLIVTERYAPYEYSWSVPSGTSYGEHKLVAKAFDAEGLVATHTIKIYRVR